MSVLLFSVIPDFDEPISTTGEENVVMKWVPLHRVDGSLMLCTKIINWAQALDSEKSLKKSNYGHDWTPLKKFAIQCNGPQLTLVRAYQHHAVGFVQGQAAARSWNECFLIKFIHYVLTIKYKLTCITIQSVFSWNISKTSYKLSWKTKTAEILRMKTSSISKRRPVISLA